MVHYDVQPSHSPLPSPSHQLSAQGEGGHDIYLYDVQPSHPPLPSLSHLLSSLQMISLRYWGEKNGSHSPLYVHLS